MALTTAKKEKIRVFKRPPGTASHRNCRSEGHLPGRACQSQSIQIPTVTHKENCFTLGVQFFRKPQHFRINKETIICFTYNYVHNRMFILIPLMMQAMLTRLPWRTTRGDPGHKRDEISHGTWREVLHHEIAVPMLLPQQVGSTHRLPGACQVTGCIWQALAYRSHPFTVQEGTKNQEC